MATAGVSSRIPSLDGWRGIAILLVLIEHFLWGALGRNPLGLIGQHGVAVFFVLSGYLITSRIQEESDLKTFYIRRFFRLMPAAWLYLLVATALVTLSGVHLKATELLSCVFFFRNYISEGTTLTSHFWTLSMEEQFYLLWPAVLLMLRSRKARAVACILALVIAANRFIHQHALLSPPFSHIFHSQYRADALLVGCIAALTPELRKWLKTWTVFPLLAAFCACIVRYGVFIPLGESIVIALLLVATTNSAKLSALLGCTPLVYLGAISYSLYLWQQLFLLAFPGRHAGGMAMNLAMLFAIASVSHYWLEAPLIRYGRGLTAKSATNEPGPCLQGSVTNE